MLVSAIGIVIAWLNLVPTKVSTIGVVLQSDDRHAIRVVLMLVVYFTVSFAMTALAAWLERHRDLRKAEREASEHLAEYERRQPGLEEQIRNDRDKRTSAWSSYETNVVSLIEEVRRRRTFRVLTKTEGCRAALDFFLPVAMGLAAIIWLGIGLG